ncbi:universal stress protein [Oceaniglobus roseus]|uniref:universal stress protein n=1 Tax=Oceaniglobus roseus TaxID=1737570 RepID=UPI0013000C6E|nr:universal stress protein [Kandeliimicrobium roseum]
MPFPSLSTILLGAGARSTLGSAAACAAAWKARLDVVWIEPLRIEADIVVPGYGGAMPVLGASFSAASEREVELALDHAQAVVQDMLEDADFGWSFQGLSGELLPTMRAAVRSALYADLLVIELGGTARPEAATLAEAALFGARVPVLALPALPEPRFGRIVIAWDGSAQSLAAVRAALPLLKAAADVRLVQVDAAAGSDGAPPSAGVVRMLSAHGVAASVFERRSQGRSIAVTLADYVGDSAADLLVMGAYGHSRLREQILGGVTRDMLRQTGVSLFLAR